MLYEVITDWRLLGKLNHSFSDSSLGEFFGGGYTVNVSDSNGLGYLAWRAVSVV